MHTRVNMLPVQKRGQDLKSWDLIIVTRPGSCLLGNRSCRGKLMGIQQFTLLRFFGWWGELKNYIIRGFVLLG